MTSFHLCLYAYGAAWPRGPDCLGVDNRDAGGYADPSLMSIVRFS